MFINNIDSAFFLISLVFLRRIMEAINGNQKWSERISYLGALWQTNVIHCVCRKIN